MAFITFCAGHSRHGDNLENSIFPGPERERCKAWACSRMTDIFSSGIGFLTVYLLYLYGKKGRFVCAGSLQQMN